MDARELLRQAIETLRADRGRAAASALGVFAGAAGILVLLAFGAGFRAYMVGELSRFGSGAVMLFPVTTSSGHPGYREGVPVRLARADLEAAERATHGLVDALLPEHQLAGRALVEAGGRVRRLDLSGVDHRYARYRHFEIGHGRFFEPADVARSRAVAVLGHEAAVQLFGSAAGAVGGRLRVEGRPFVVVGVAARKGRQYVNTHRPDNRLLLVPITSAEERLGFSDQAVSRALLFPHRGVVPARAVAAVLADLGPRAGFHPDDADAVKSFDLTALLGVVDLFYSGFLTFIGVMGTITLLVGGVGIANHHLATLAERSVEIAVARAIGARSRVLVAQTLLESGIVSAAAAGLGVACGGLICAGLAAAIPPGAFPRPIVSAPVAGIVALALLGVAALASGIPALRVRRMDVSAALRSG